MIKETEPFGTAVLPPDAKLPKTPEQLRKEKREAAKLKKAEELAKRKGLLMQIEVRHNFNQAEMIKLGSDLNAKFRALQEKDLQRKAVMADYKSAIDTIKAEIEGLSNKHSNQFEMRRQECLVFFKPKERTRFVFTTEGKFLHTEEMHESDFQTKMFPELGTKYEEGSDLTKKQLKDATAPDPKKV